MSALLDWARPLSCQPTHNTTALTACMLRTAVSELDKLLDPVLVLLVVSAAVSLVLIRAVGLASFSQHPQLLHSTHDSTTVTLVVTLLHAAAYLQPFCHIPHPPPASTSIVLFGLLCVVLVALTSPRKDKLVASVCLQLVFSIFGVETITTTILPRTIQLPATCCFVTLVLVTAQSIEKSIGFNYSCAKQVVDKDHENQPAFSAIAIGSDATCKRGTASLVVGEEEEGHIDVGSLANNLGCTNGHFKQEANDNSGSAEQEQVANEHQLVAYGRSHRHEAKSRKSIVFGRIRMRKDQTRLPRLPSSFIRAVFFGQSERVLIHHPLFFHSHTTADDPIRIAPLSPLLPGFASDADETNQHTHKPDGFPLGDSMKASLGHHKRHRILVDSMEDAQENRSVDDDLCGALAISEHDPIIATHRTSHEYHASPTLCIRSCDPNTTTIATALLDQFTSNDEEIQTSLTTPGSGYGSMDDEDWLGQESLSNSLYDARAATISSSSQSLHALEHDAQHHPAQTAVVWSRWDRSKAWRSKLRAWIQMSSRVQQQQQQQQQQIGVSGDTDTGAGDDTASTCTTTCNDMRLLIGSTAPRTSTVGLFGTPPDLEPYSSSTTPHCTSPSATNCPSTPHLRPSHRRQSSNSSEDSLYFIAEFSEDLDIDD